jgi:hypothetical protein
MVGGDGSFELEDISDTRRFLRLKVCVIKKRERERQPYLYACGERTW